MSAVSHAVSAPEELATRTFYLSHFTPSIMPPETLEAMLVQREPVLSRSLAHVVESLRTGSRHHTLFVGPRGIGKTHLISLLHHRLIKTPEANDHALVAWMLEEEWGVTSFFELMLRILRTLDATYPQLNISPRIQTLYELPLNEAEKQAESLLLEVLGEKCLVVLVENLDDLFEQIGDQGQKAWRAFIQNHGNMVLVCSTPSLFAGVSLHKSAFYGFFDIESLVELEFEDVVSLLGKIAVGRGDQELAAFIDTAEGQARIRAMHHLAEGNPRIYIIFAQFLNKEALDELVKAFMHTLDELTPYYQARMKDLSAQQRKIVEYLVTYRGAAPVNQIAKACFITQQVCSSQLGQLKEKRYVRTSKEGRGSFYELSEPLMRLCMEVKRQRGEPISLFVEMLRIWYRMDELQEWLARPEEGRRFESNYLDRAIEGLKQHGDPKIVAILRDLSNAIVRRDVNRILDLHNELKAIGVVEPACWVYVAVALVDLGIPTTPTSPAEVEELTHSLVNLILNQDLFFDDPVNKLIAYVSVSFATYRLNPRHSPSELPKLWEEIKRFPAASQLAMILLIRTYGRDHSFAGWFQQVLQYGTYSGASNRIFAGLDQILAALQSGKSAKFLALPKEHRKLLTNYFQPAFDHQTKREV